MFPLCLLLFFDLSTIPYSNWNIMSIIYGWMAERNSKLNRTIETPSRLSVSSYSSTINKVLLQSSMQILQFKPFKWLGIKHLRKILKWAYNSINIFEKKEKLKVSLIWMLEMHVFLLWLMYHEESQKKQNYE